MTGAPAALVAAIVLQFVWIGIGLATNWDPYPFVFLLTCSNVIQLILIFVIAVAQRQLSLHDELKPTMALSADCSITRRPKSFCSFDWPKSSTSTRATSA